MEKDPWNTIPLDKRLDFKVVGQPMEELAAATVNKIDRQFPPRLMSIRGAQPLFLLLVKIALTTYHTIKYFSAETPPDPARKIEFASSSPPLLRSLVDAIFTVVFLSADLNSNVPWYYRSGWREQAEWGAKLRQRYAGAMGWKEWLGQYDALLEQSWRDMYVTGEQKENPSLISWWPTPAQMLKAKTLSDTTRDFLQYLNDWIYRTLSQGTHLTYPGVVWRGGTMLREKDDHLREPEWFKKRSDTVGDAVLFLLAFLTEVNNTLAFDLGPRYAYVWGVWKEYDTSAAELYDLRYRSLLNSGGS